LGIIAIWSGASAVTLLADVDVFGGAADGWQPTKNNKMTGTAYRKIVCFFK